MHEMEAIAALKLDTVKNILKALLEGKTVSHHDLAKKLSISSQGLTWQMNRLRETGMIQQNKNGLTVTYAIDANYVSVIAKGVATLEE